MIYLYGRFKIKFLSTIKLNAGHGGMERNNMADKRKNTKRRLTPMEKGVNAILVIVVIAVFALAVYAVAPKVSENLKNVLPQEAGPNTSIVSGMAESLDLTVDEFKAEYGLADDVTGDTLMADIADGLTLANYAKLNGQEYAALVEEMGLTDKVTETTTWGEAEPQIPFGNYVGGEETFNQIKETYALDDSITMDTPWGEVEPVLEQRQQELIEAQQNAASAEAQAETEDGAGEVPEASETAE